MRSRGAFEFRTKPSDFGRIGGKIRLMAERGETHLLPLCVSETMVATNASYSEELYNISRRIFGSPTNNRRDKYYSLHQEYTVSDLSLVKMKDMYATAQGLMVDMSSYVAVAKRSNDLDSIVDYAQRIFLASGRFAVPAWTFLLDGKEMVLYVRRFFLESFKTGLDILNIVRIQEKVREAKEKKRSVRRVIREKRYNKDNFWL